MLGVRLARRAVRRATRARAATRPSPSATREAARRGGPRSAGIWRYRPLLPVRGPDPPVTLGEGDTPLIEARRVAAAPAADQERGAEPDRLVQGPAGGGGRDAWPASSGSRACCAHRPGTPRPRSPPTARARASRCAASCPRARPAAKLAQVAGRGRAASSGSAATTATPTRSRARAAERFGWANLTSTYVNPYMLEGDKTLGLELLEQLGGRTPDWVVVPVGAGPLLAGIGKAWEELGAGGIGPAADGRPGERLRADRAGLRGGGGRGRGVGRPSRAPPPPRSPTRCADTRRTARARSCHPAQRRPGHRRVGGGDRRRRGPPRAGSRACSPSPAPARRSPATSSRSSAVSSAPTDLAVIVVTGHGLKDVDALGGAAGARAGRRPGRRRRVRGALEAAARA